MGWLMEVFNRMNDERIINRDVLSKPCKQKTNALDATTPKWRILLGAILSNYYQHTNRCFFLLLDILINQSDCVLLDGIGDSINQRNG